MVERLFFGIAGPAVASRIANLLGLVEACGKAASSSEEELTLNTALLINNLAALGGEEAVVALTRDETLMRQLASWLDDAHDAATLQRLTGMCVIPTPASCLQARML
jgi:hypothetical protein